MSISRSLAPPHAGAATAIFLLLLGALAGFLNGLLGTGGGIAIVYVMRRYYARHASDESDRDAYATALSVMLPISVFSVVHYIRADALDLASFAPMLLPTIAGGVLGGILLDKLKLAWLSRLFALLVLISGIFMIVRA